MIFAADQLLPLWIVLGVTGFFGALVLIVILVKRRFSSLQIKKDEEITEEQAVQQELDRILVPVDELEEKKEESTIEEVKNDDAKEN